MAESDSPAGSPVQGGPPGKPVLRLAVYNKKTVRILEPASPEEAAELERSHRGEYWLDVVAPDLNGYLKGIDVRQEPGDHYIRDCRDRTIFQIPFVVRSSTEMQYLYIISDGKDHLTTVRRSTWPKGPVESTLQFIQDQVEEETDFGTTPLPILRDFLFAALLGACSDEYLATLSAARHRVNGIYDEIIREEDPKRAQQAIYEVHSFLSETFGTALFLFREFISLVRRGGGKHLSLARYQNYLEKILNDVDQAMQMRDGLENTLDLISNTLRTSLSDRNIANTERLNRAVEILTRLSVLLMIPNSVFTLWPTMPISNDDEFLGIKSVGWELLLALGLTILGQVLISYFYKHSYMRDILARRSGEQGK